MGTNSSFCGREDSRNVNPTDNSLPSSDKRENAWCSAFTLFMLGRKSGVIFTFRKLRHVQRVSDFAIETHEICSLCCRTPSKQTKKWLVLRSCFPQTCWHTEGRWASKCTDVFCKLLASWSSAQRSTLLTLVRKSTGRMNKYWRNRTCEADCILSVGLLEFYPV
jgi:hypothetical protein